VWADTENETRVLRPVSTHTPITFMAQHFAAPRLDWLQLKAFFL
jgi:hypothetical protein